MIRLWILGIQFAVIIVGEALAAKNHNQAIQNYTQKKFCLICKKNLDNKPQIC